MSLNKRLMSSAPPPFVASENFKVVIYTGNGASTHAITGVGFQPDWVWIANRTNSHSPKMSDSSRGPNKYVYSNQGQTEQNMATSIKSFDADGFTLGTETNSNQNGLTYVAWCWKINGGTTATNTNGSNINSTVQVNNTLGISIVLWEGTGNATHTVGHGLSTAPNVILSKNRDSTDVWQVYHSGAGSGAKFGGHLDSNAAFNTSAGTHGGWDVPTSTVMQFSNGSSSIDNLNTSGESYLAYCFHDIEGYSKYNSYTGNGSTNGPIVETGFEVGYLLIKRSSGADNWVVFDNVRNTTNPRTKALIVSDAGENTEVGAQINFYSNGFQSVGTGGGAGSGGVNTNNETYIYMAFAADPDEEAPTVASSFNTLDWTGTGSSRSVAGFGFSPNLVWYKERSSTSGHELLDTMRGPTNYIMSSSSNAQATSAQGLQSFNTDGFSVGNDGAVNQSSQTYIAWGWKADDNEPTILEQGANDSDTILTYRFENDSTDDSTGTYNGTASNITFTSTGPFGNSVEFNGSSSQIVNSSFTRTQNYTVSLWLNTDTSSGERMAIALNWSAGTGRVAIGIKDGGIKYQDGNSGWLTILSSVSTDTWYHVAITYDHSSTTAKAYLNGSEVVSTSTTVAVPSTGGGLYLGQFGSSAGYWDGEVSRVRIYNSALGSSDITTLYNESIKALVSANSNAGFSIVKWDGTGDASSKVPHGLSATPEWFMMKDLSEAGGWNCTHVSLDSDEGIGLGSNAAAYTSMGNNGGVIKSNLGSTTFGFAAGAQTVNSVNKAGNQYIAYLWHGVSGYSKFGTYTGNGSATGNSVACGFEPDFLMVKRSDSSGDWAIADTARSLSNYPFNTLEANNNNAEITSGDDRMYSEMMAVGHAQNSTGGFRFRNSDGPHNISGAEYIFIAFKRNITSDDSAGKMSWLCVAGGGSGGRGDARSGAGGGAGGFRTSYGTYVHGSSGAISGGGKIFPEGDIHLSAGTYTITVGAGGAATSGSDGTGNDGGNSSIAATGLTTITSIGGGGGGYPGSGRAGGSGGGGAHGGGAAGSGTADQGYAGGQGIGEASYNGGGGGGASAAGSNSSTSAGGNGGAGLASSITGSSVTYAGGGGGGGGGTAGSGGSGGGGAGATTTGTSGTANTGGGGGGARSTSGAGGSGVVILRLLTSEYSGSTTGSPTVTTSGSSTIIKFTSSGTYVHS